MRHEPYRASASPQRMAWVILLSLPSKGVHHHLAHPESMDESKHRADLHHRHRSVGSVLHPIPYGDAVSALLQGETGQAGALSQHRTAGGLAEGHHGGEWLPHGRGCAVLTSTQVCSRIGARMWGSRVPPHPQAGLVLLPPSAPQG